MSIIMASHKLLFLFFIVFLYSATAETADPTYLGYTCSGNSTANSSYQLDVSTLLSSLSSNATSNTEFYNTTVTGRSSSDTIYGLFMCRGDVPPQICRQCVVIAAQRVFSVCPLNKEAIIWYEECFLRYSDRYFFSTVDTSASYSLVNVDVVSRENYLQVLLNLNTTADDAANASLGAKKYNTTKAAISGLGTMYFLAECTPDLSPHDCRSCLSEAIVSLPGNSSGRRGARLLYPSCHIRYELYRFYYPDPHETEAPTPTPTVLLPPTNSSDSPVSAENGKGRSPRAIVIVVVVSIAIAGLLICFAYYLLRSKMKKHYEAAVAKNYYSRAESRPSQTS